MNNLDKVTAYINDAKSLNIQILPPDVNESLWLFNVIGKTIRFGMGAIKNVGEGAVIDIIREREKAGPFDSFLSFCERVSLKTTNKRVLESLIKVGAFDLIETYNRKTLIENLENITTFAQNKQNEKAQGQANLFELESFAKDNGDSELTPDVREVDDFEDKEKLNYEAELMGIYVSGHPLDNFKKVILELSSLPIEDIQTMPMPERVSSDDDYKRNVVLGGMLSITKAVISKKGDKMCFASLEDMSGKIECVVFPKTFAEYSHLLSHDEPVLVSGFINLKEDPRKFFPMKIQTLSKVTDETIKEVVIKIKTMSLNNHSLPRLKNTLLSYRGSVPLHIEMETEDGKVNLFPGENFYVNASPQLAQKVNEILNQDAVSYLMDSANL